MFRNLFRLVLGAAIVAASLGVAVAQEREKTPEDYRRFFRKPENVLEFWKALRFELDVGRPDLAAKHLHGLLDLKPTDAQLLNLVDEVGLTPILQLRNVRVWSKDAKEQKQAEADVNTLIRRTTEAARKRRLDPERIRGLIRQLQASPEERTWARRELYKTGAPAMPYLIEALRKARGAGDRLAVRQAIEEMGPGAVAPLVAALDADDVQLKLDILDILQRRYVRYSRQIVPHLWFPSASKAESRQVRRKATEVLAEFLDMPASRLMPARAALTREAERYYRGDVTFGDPRAVVIWRWDGKGVVQGWPKVPTVSASQAQEYWGLRFARQALDLDPTYRPAQVVFLALALEKAVQRGGLNAPLSRTAPAVADLVAKADTALLLELLERGLKEERTGLILPIARILGDRAEVRAKRPTGRGDPALVRALYYPDPRVQMTAAESLLLIPGPPAPKTAARIVDIMARMLTPAATAVPGRKVIVGIFEEDWRNRTDAAVQDAGVVPLPVSNGRDLMRQVRRHGDVDAILVGSALPQPGLVHLLAQLRADVDVARVPILVAAVPRTRRSIDIVARARVIDRRLDMINDETRIYRATLRAIDEEEAARLKETEKGKMASEERHQAQRLIRERYEDERKRLDQKYLKAVALAKDAVKLEAEKDRLAARYDVESQAREGELARFTARYPNVRVVHATLFTNPKALESAMRAAIREAGVALTPEQRSRYAEVAIQILSKLAQGQPRGYDVQPAAGVILDALRTGRLSPQGQIAAIDAAARLPGSRPQAELAHTILDKARPGEVRTAAVEGLVQSVQRFGVQLTEGQIAPLRELSREDKLPKGLKPQLAVLIGALRPDARTTGERLKRYTPRPVAPLPPPPPPKK
jgi:hypothetical protein